MNKKVTFTLSIGFAGAEHKETLTLKELGVEALENDALEKALNEAWQTWMWNHIDGGFILS